MAADAISDCAPEARGHGAPGQKHDKGLMSWVPELKAIIRLAGPNVIQGAAQMAMLVTDQIFLGHLGTNSLAAASLGNTYSNIMWFFLLGSSTALDTLGAQAHGANNHEALVTVTFTTAVVLSVLCAVLSVALCFGRVVALTLFGQDPEVASLVGTYCFGLIPGMWPLVLGVTLMKYLQTQNIMMVPAIITGTAFCLNIAANAALIHLIGFKGAPLATSLSRFLQFLMLAYAVYRHEHSRSTTKGASRTSLAGATGQADASLEDEESSLMEAYAASIAPESGCHVSNGEIQLEMQPYRGPSQLASSACLKAGTATADRPNRGFLRTQLSWFPRVSTFRTVPWSPAMSAEAGSECMADGTSSQGPAKGFRHVAYLLSQSKAAVRPVLLVRYLRLALPGGFMMAFEASSFDVTTAMAGHLGSVVTAAHASMLSVIMLTYFSLPFAIATAATIRVGNLLGAGQPDVARRSAFLSVSMSTAFMAVSAVVIMACKGVLGRAFSPDPDVISTMATIAPFAALFQVSDGVMGGCQGVLRGCGRQAHLMVYNFLGFWLTGVMLGYFLTFKRGMGVRGLWIGIASGDTATAVLNLVTMLLVNWDREAVVVGKRMHAEQQHDEQQAMVRAAQQDSSSCTATVADAKAGGDASLAAHGMSQSKDSSEEVSLVVAALGGKLQGDPWQGTSQE